MTDPSSRTEPPSPRALRRARERGDAPRSAIASLAFGWLGLGLGLAAGMGGALEGLRAFAVRVFSLEALTAPSPFHGALGEAAALGGRALLGPLTGACLAGVVGALVVLGRVHLVAVGPDLGRLAPSRNVSMAVDLRPRLGALAAAALLGLVLADLFMDAAPGLFGRVQAETAPLAAAAERLGEALLGRIGAALSLLAVAAIAYARYAFRDRHRMTRRERQREQRETEGDPTAKRRRRARHLELSEGMPLGTAAARRARLLEAALLVRGDGLTVLLGWRDPDAAPTLDVAVSGPAAALLALEGRGVPTVLDPGLALGLARLPVGGAVPRRLWARVARPLARGEARQRG